MTEEAKKTYIDIAAETLSGDLRDVMLTHIRSMQDPWSKLSEAKQQDKIYAVTNACETVVRRAVTLVAAHGQEIMHCKISKFTVKDEIKAELVAGSSVGNIERIAENIGQAMVLVFASPDAFLGQRAPVTAEPDQPALPIDGDTEVDNSEGDSTSEDDQTGDDDADSEMPAADPSDAPKAV